MNGLTEVVSDRSGSMSGLVSAKIVLPKIECRNRLTSDLQAVLLESEDWVERPEDSEVFSNE